MKAPWLATLALGIVVYVNSMTFHSGAAVGSHMQYRLETQAESDRASMDAIRQNLTVEQAVSALQHKAGVMALVQENMQHHVVMSNKKHSKQAPAAGGVQGAKAMLNEMIEESNGKLDFERVRCSEVETKTSGLMEESRQDIASFNAQAASARAEILRANTQIEGIGQKLPQLGAALHSHVLQCTQDTAALQSQLNIVMDDIQIMGNVLEMASCADPAASSLLQCRHKRRNRGLSFVSLGSRHIRKKVAELKSHDLQKKVRAVLADTSASPTGGRFMTDQGRETLHVEDSYKITTEDLPSLVLQKQHGLSFLQTRQEPDEAEDDTSDDPQDPEKQMMKCSIGQNPNCANMRDKFLLIQAGVSDKRSELQSQLDHLGHSCEDTKLNYEAQITDFETRLKDEQTALARGTEQQNEAEEQSRLKGIEFVKFQKEYTDGMKLCEKNIEGFQVEVCSLGKIRAEIFKIAGSDDEYFQDCEVSSWNPQPCTTTCGGGTQQLSRSVTAHPTGGAECPPLQMERACNQQPCPTDCRVGDFSDWSACSANCGGGIKSRAASVEVQPMNGGEPCGETSETEACNIQSCSRDCDLGDWSAWSPCTKMCNSGLKYRMKPVIDAAFGQGTCAHEDEPDRLEFEMCNTDPCVVGVNAPTLRCDSKLDIILALDGSGSLGPTGWNAMKEFGAMFANAMSGGESDINLAVLLFSGPTTYAALERCTGASGETPNMETDCGIQWVQHFSFDTAAAATAIEGLEWPDATTLTSAALATAEGELQYGRQDAAAVVVFVTDGHPMSPLRTFQAAKSLREKARLMMVPVTSFAPVDQMRQWVSHPVHENLIMVEDFRTLSVPDTVSDIIADMCPHVY